MVEEELVKNNVMPFYEEGIFECTVNRSNKLLKQLGEVLKQHEIPISIGRGFKIEQVKNKDSPIPALSVQGEKIVIEILVPPIDKYGNESKSYLTKDELNVLQEKVKSDGNEKLIISE